MADEALSLRRYTHRSSRQTLDSREQEDHSNYYAGCADALGRQRAKPQSFGDPPDTVRPWVFWFWMNGNISRGRITRDLESIKRVRALDGSKWPVAGATGTH